MLLPVVAYVSLSMLVLGAFRLRRGLYGGI